MINDADTLLPYVRTVHLLGVVESITITLRPQWPKRSHVNQSLHNGYNQKRPPTHNGLSALARLRVIVIDANQLQAISIVHAAAKYDLLHQHGNDR